MKHAKISLKITILIIVLFSQKSYAYYFKKLGIKDGLSQISVMAIHQDVLGRMWFGTMEGLSIFDGVNMFSLKGGNNQFKAFFQKNRIYTIVENSDHDIFLRAEDALIQYKFKQGEFKCLEQSGITALSSFQGKIFVAKKDSIFFLNRQGELDLYTKTSLKNIITRIFFDSSSNLWIGTNKGLYKQSDVGYKCIIKEKDIYEIYESQTKDLWIGTRKEGMYKIGYDGKITEYLHSLHDYNSLSDNQVRAFAEDDKGNLWIGTFAGLNKLSVKNNQFSFYKQQNIPGSLPNSSIYSLFKDSNGFLWIGTYYGGVSFFHPDMDSITYFPSIPDRHDCLNFPFVGDIVEDKHNNLWICTEGGGLDFMNRKTQRFSYFTTKHNNLKSICYDSIQNKLYMGTYTGGLMCYDIKRNRFKSYFYDHPEITDKSFSYVLNVRLFRDKIFFSTPNGLYQLNTKKDEISRFLNIKQCLSFMIDSRNNIWITSWSDIIRINLDDTTRVKKFNYKDIGIGAYNLSSGYESRDGKIFFGTSGAGVLEYDYETDSFFTYTAAKNGLLSDYCYSIAQSKKGFIVMLGDKGLTFFNPLSKKGEYLIDAARLPDMAFNEGNRIFVAADGSLFLGSTNGLMRVSEDDVLRFSKTTSLFFSDLFINNKKVEPGDNTKILKQILPFTHSITLNYNQNNIEISFAGNGYTNFSSLSSYEYMLEGLQKEWVSTNLPRLTFTSLKPGKYKLKVRYKKLDMDASAQEIMLPIIISSPYYNTLWAWIIYILLILGSLYAFFYIRLRQRYLKESLKYERREKEHIEELDRFKVLFFTNVSHELRMPLTLIITQIELLMARTDISKTVSGKIKNLYKHTYQLRNLISELLDFHKIEQQQMILKVSEQNAVPFMKDIYHLFSEHADTLHIQYSFTASSDNITCYFDPKQLQKVFFNLIYNAFKYTAKCGSVRVSLSEEGDDVVFRITDNGSGINNEELNLLFERFYQTSANIAGCKDAGSGIGLALSKNIVMLHHGEISVKSKPGYGSIFIVRLKKGKAHFELDSKVEFIDKEINPIYSNSIPDASFISQLSENKTDIEDKNKYSILIVEDNKELLSMLIDIFSPLYNIITATNGKDALQKVQEENPNIVLSDIMMPEMDGTQMCMKIKSNINTSHIPVVLLTARSSEEHQIEGLIKGADDYIIKPFDPKVLLVKINSILRNREILYSLFRKQTQFHSELLAKNDLDREFIKKVENAIDLNIENPDLDVDKLAQEVAVGRSSFFKKLKTLTGMTPANFILSYRLKQAAYLLQNQPQLQIKDIAYRLGFSSSHYFSRCFKNHFNVSPVNYRKNMRSDSATENSHEISE